MTGLQPEQRWDKNGVLNTKWVRPKANSITSSVLPPPNLSPSSSKRLSRAHGLSKEDKAIHAELTKKFGKSVQRTEGSFGYDISRSFDKLSDETVAELGRAVREEEFNDSVGSRYLLHVLAKGGDDEVRTVSRYMRCFNNTDGYTNQKADILVRLLPQIEKTGFLDEVASTPVGKVAAVEAISSLRIASAGDRLQRNREYIQLFADHPDKTLIFHQAMKERNLEPGKPETIELLRELASNESTAFSSGTL